MKHDRNGQSAILTEDQLLEILGEMEGHHRLLFAICYYTSCRIQEALKLEARDIKKTAIIFRAETTKTKQTREVSISPKLRVILDECNCGRGRGFLFPARSGDGHMTRQAADLALRKVCDYCGFEGISTHSFRRTGITKMHTSGVSLKVIQKHTGHKDMDSLLRYIEIGDEEVVAAVNLL